MMTETVARKGRMLITQTFDYAGWVDKARSDADVNKYSHAGSRGFTHSGSFDEAIKLAELGWRDGRKHIKQMEATLNKGISAMQYQDHVRSDVAGEWYDVGDVIAGLPDAARFMERTVEMREGKIVDVYVNLSTSCAVKTDVFIMKGAAVCALVDALESAGYRCNIYGLVAQEEVGGMSSKWECAVTVKEADQHLDMDNIAFALAHPSSFRRLAFGLIEGIDKRHGTTYSRSNYGMPSSHSMESNKGIVIGHTGSWQVWTQSVDKARAWVKETLEKYVEMDK